MRILIVDDEPLVRKGLVSMLEKLDMTEIETANNGEAGKEMIRSFKPDLVLMDIVMPKVDGIELLKWIMLNYPEVRSIVLSSHQDFHYVKQAFVFGASDYILKYDINEEILKETITRAMNRGKSESISRESKVDALLFGGASAESCTNADMTVLAITDGDRDALKQALSGLEGVSAYSLTGATAYGIASKKEGEQAAQMLAQRGYCVGLSNFGKPTEAVTLRQQAEAAAARCFFTGERKVYKYTPVTHELPEDITELKKEITEQILGASLARLLDRLDALYERLKKETGVSVIAVKIMYTSIADMLAMKYPAAFINGGLNIDSVNKRIIDAQYLRDIRQTLKECMNAVMDDLLQVIDVSGCSKITRVAIEYINRHYSEGTLGLDVVAEKLGYTASYLSRVFKKDTGVNVIDYINEIRILIARKMLAEGDKKVYEVAEEVGYNNYNHFSKTFKRTTGVTPSQYIEDIRRI